MMKTHAENIVKECNRIKTWPALGVSLLLFFFALAIRLLYLTQAATFPTFFSPIIDSQSYLQLAQRITAELPIGEQLYWQPQFYPLFLVGVFQLFGESIWLIKIIQAVVGAFSCVMIYWVGRIGLSHREGVMASLMMALYGPILFFEAELLGEGWAIFWVCSLLLLFLLSEKSDNPLIYGLLGFAGGFAVLTRPPLLIFFAVSSLWFSWLLYKRSNLYDAFIRGALILVAFAMISCHAAYRCKATTGKFSFLPHSAGINLYVGNNADWIDTVSARPGYDWQHISNIPSDNGITNVWKASAYFQKQVKDYAIQHPVQFAQGIFLKTIRFINSREMPRNISIYDHRQWSPLLSATTWKLGSFGFPFGLLLPLCLVGLIWNIRRIPMPILACLIIYPPVIILYFVSARYRLLCIPAMILIAAAGLASLYDASRLHHTKRIAISVSVILLTVLIASFPVQFHEETIDYEAEMYRSLGYQFIERRAFAQAVPYLEKALELDPELVSALNDLSMSLSELGDQDRAMLLSTKAIQLSPEQAGLHYNRGLICLGSGLAVQAEESFRKAIVIEPNRPLLHLYLGQSLMQQKRWKEALDELDEELAMNPDNPAALQMAISIRKSIARGKSPGTLNLGIERLGKSNMEY